MWLTKSPIQETEGIRTVRCNRQSSINLLVVLNSRFYHPINSYLLQAVDSLVKQGELVKKRAEAWENETA